MVTKRKRGRSTPSEEGEREKGEESGGLYPPSPHRPAPPYTAARRQSGSLGKPGEQGASVTPPQRLQRPPLGQGLSCPGDSRVWSPPHPRMTQRWEGQAGHLGWSPPLPPGIGHWEEEVTAPASAASQANSPGGAAPEQVPDCSEPQGAPSSSSARTGE